MIYVTENGVSEKMQCTDLCDDWRMQYFREYINELLKGDALSSVWNGKLSGRLNVSLCLDPQPLETAST